MRLIQLCLGIVGIPFLIVGISYVTKHTRTLPVDTEHICVYSIVQSGTDMQSAKGVGSYRKDGIWVTAYHVVQGCAGDCLLATQGGEKKTLQDIKRVGTSDLALFRISGNYMCTRAGEGTIVSSIVSGMLFHAPVIMDGDNINLEVSYGQSGSPVYQDGELVGVVSQRAQGYSRMELIRP